VYEKGSSTLGLKIPFVTALVCSAVMHVAFGHLTSLSWRFLYSRAFAPESLFLL
jgi:hypothetical protein